MGVSGTPFSIGGREDRVDKEKGPHNLSSKAVTFGVAMADQVGSAALQLVLAFLEALYDGCTAYGSKALHHHVKHRPY